MQLNGCHLLIDEYWLGIGKKLLTTSPCAAAAPFPPTTKKPKKLEEEASTISFCKKIYNGLSLAAPSIISFGGAHWLRRETPQGHDKMATKLLTSKLQGRKKLL